MNVIFNVAECAREVIEVLEKHKATFANMKEVFKLVKKDVILHPWRVHHLKLSRTLPTLAWRFLQETNEVFLYRQATCTNSAT